jgi:enoyl-CoA hydratase/carnithine racemase
MNRLRLIRQHLTSNRSIANFKSDLIQIESHNDLIKIIRLNNLSKWNVITEKLLEDLLEAFLVLDKDPKTKVIILTGSEKVFCAGADINYLTKTSYQSILRHDYLQSIEEISYKIGKPIIAAVSGFCLGGGFEIALACDIIGSTKATKFGFPEIKLGLFPGAGGTQRLSRISGYYKASEMILSGETYDAETIKNIGVLNYIYPDYESLMKHTLALAVKISNYSFIALKTTKLALKASLETTLRQGINTERNIFYGLFGTDDKKIGTEAFLKKTKPEFVDN